MDNNLMIKTVLTAEIEEKGLEKKFWEREFGEELEYNFLCRLPAGRSPDIQTTEELIMRCDDVMRALKKLTGQDISVYMPHDDSEVWLYQFVKKEDSDV